MSLKPGNSPVQSHISQMSLKLVAAGFELGVGKVPLQIEQPPSTSTMKAAQGAMANLLRVLDASSAMEICPKSPAQYLAAYRRRASTPMEVT